MIQRIRKSLTAKTVLGLLAVIIPLSATNIVISWQSAIAMLQSDRALAEKRLVFQGGKNIENYINRLDAILLSVYSSNRFLTNLAPAPQDFENKSRNEQFLLSLLYGLPDIRYLYLYTRRDGTLLSLSKQRTAYHPLTAIETSQTDWINQVLRAPDGVFIGQPGSFVNLRKIGNAGDEPVFMMSRRLFNIETDETLGVLAIAVSLSTIKTMSNNLQTAPEFLAIYEQGRLFYSSVPDPVLRQAAEKANSALSVQNDQDLSQGVFRLGSESNLCTRLPLTHHLVLLKAVPFSLLQISASRTLVINLIALGVVAVLLLMTTIIVVYPVIRPIRTLSRAMAQVGAGNFAIETMEWTSIKRIDEIGGLNQGFQNMVVNLQHLVDQEYKARISMQEAQLRALQAQINPHFLFNAIQSIGTLALHRQAPEIYETTLALAGILRYALRSDHVASSIADELHHAQKYLEIQKLRFADRLSVSWDIDQSLVDTKIPVLILQPLVENAILHNLEQSRRPLAIAIGLRRLEGLVEMSIRDDGLGIASDTLCALRNDLEKGIVVLSEDSHIGLRNVAERLRIYYSGQCRLIIESEPGAGTVVRLCLPEEV